MHHWHGLELLLVDDQLVRRGGVIGEAQRKGLLLGGLAQRQLYPGLIQQRELLPGGRIAGLRGAHDAHFDAIGRGHQQDVPLRHMVEQELMVARPIEAVADVIVVDVAGSSRLRCIEDVQRGIAVLAVLQEDHSELERRQPLNGDGIEGGVVDIRRAHQRLGGRQIRLELLQLAAGKAQYDLLALRRPAAALHLLALVQRVHLKVSALLQGVHPKGAVAEDHGQAVGQHGIPQQLHGVHIVLWRQANAVNWTNIRRHKRGHGIDAQQAGAVLGVINRQQVAVRAARDVVGNAGQGDEARLRLLARCLGIGQILKDDHCMEKQD